MNERQKELADKIIKFFQEKEGLHFTTDEISHSLNLTESTETRNVRYVIAILESKGILEAEQYTIYTYQTTGVGYRYFLADKGWLYENYETFLIQEAMEIENEKLNKEIDLDIKRMTKDNLGWQRWPKKYWWLVVLLTIIITAVVTAILQRLI